jgi:hypothetical protein
MRRVRLALPLFILISKVRISERCTWHRRQLMSLFLYSICVLLNRDTHVTTIASLAAVTFIFTDTAFNANASILATSTRALAIATLLTLATALAARLGGEVLLISAELVLEIDRATRDLARGAWAERRYRRCGLVGRLAHGSKDALALVLLDQWLGGANLGGRWAALGLLCLGGKFFIQDVLLTLALDALVNAIRAVITAVRAGKDIIQALMMALDGTGGQHRARVKSTTSRKIILVFAEVFTVARSARGRSSIGMAAKRIVEC